MKSVTKVIVSCSPYVGNSTKMTALNGLKHLKRTTAMSLSSKWGERSNKWWGVIIGEEIICDQKNLGKRYWIGAGVRHLKQYQPPHFLKKEHHHH